MKTNQKITWKPGTMLYPLPAVLVSCGVYHDNNDTSKSNIITISWAGTICSEPPMLSISIRPERYSYKIIKDTGYFVVNLTNKKLVHATDFCGVKSGKDIDKFKKLKLTPQKAKFVPCPIILESPVNIECKTKQIVKLGSHDMFIAEVLCVHVDKSLVNSKNVLNLEKSNLIAYSHGKYYTLGKYLGHFGFSVRKR